MGRRLGLIAAGVLLAVLGWSGFATWGALGAGQTPPIHANLDGVTSEVLVRTMPAAVADPELLLGRVTIAPGASIPEHRHTGTQIASFLAGELTYRVLTGEVDVMRPPDNATPPPVERLGPGDETVLRAGDAVVERPGSFHQATNRGTEPVVIVLSVLFPADEGPTVYADATPTP